MEPGTLDRASKLVTEAAWAISRCRDRFFGGDVVVLRAPRP